MADDKQSTTKNSSREIADYYRLCRLVGAEGVEPSWLAPEVFKTSMYAVPSCPRVPGPPVGRTNKKSIADQEGHLEPVPCAMLHTEDLCHAPACCAGVVCLNEGRWRRRSDSNRRIGVLQTPALTSWPRRRLNGAEDGIRTRDLLLGKETRYRCATSARMMVPRVRIELTTPQFSVACSTD